MLKKLLRIIIIFPQTAIKPLVYELKKIKKPLHLKFEFEINWILKKINIFNLPNPAILNENNKTAVKLSGRLKQEL